MPGECITHDLQHLNGADRPRACYRRDEHYADCARDGCRGCVPRSAEQGMLCRVCWAKAEDALSRVENLIVHLRSIEKMAQPLGERVDTTMEKRLILPETWMAADSLMDALGASPIPSTADIDEAFRLAASAVAAWSDPASVVETREGAKRAVVLVKRIQTALKRWPDSEVERRPIPYLACPNCRYAHLWRVAPIQQGDDLLVRCGTDDLGYGLDYPCEYTADWFDWLDTYGPIIEHIFKEQHRADLARRKGNWA